jgi:MscS family membrane protein
MQKLTQLFSSYQWQMQVISILFITLLAYYLLKTIFKKTQAYLEKHSFAWIKTFIVALYPPLATFICLEGILLTLNYLPISFGPQAVDWLNALNYAKNIILIAWFLARLILLVENHLISHHTLKLDSTLIHSIGKLLRTGIMIIVGLFLLSVIGVQFFQIKSVAILVVTVLAHYLLKIIFKRVMAYLEKHPHIWAKTFVVALSYPLIIFVWLEGGTLAIEALPYIPQVLVANLLHPLRNIGAVILLAWFSLRFIRLSENTLLTNNENLKLDRTSIHAIGRLLRIGAFIVVGLFLLPVLGVQPSGIIAFGGGSAIVAGIAARDLLANFFGGMVIFLDQPFKVGDWIKSPDREVEGIVEYIGWRLTRIRTLERRPLYIPNSIFSTISIQNNTRKKHRRIKADLGIRYQDSSKLEVLLKEIRAYIQKHPKIDLNLFNLVNFTEFGHSGLIINVYCFCVEVDWKQYRNVQEQIYMDILRIIETNGAQLAYPTQTIYHHQLSE